MNRVLVKKGSRAVIEHKLDPSTPMEERKGRIAFAVDLGNGYFVQVREARGKVPATLDELAAEQRGAKVGRGKRRGYGFRLTSGLTLEQVKELPEYADLIEQIQIQTTAILKILKSKQSKQP
jgi:hypothetical protein